MTRTLPTAVFFIGFVTVIWTVLLALVIVLPQAGMTISARFFLLLALFVIIFCTRFAARHYATRQTAALSSRDVALFTVVTTIGLWLVAMAFEAVFFWSHRQDVTPVSLHDALFAPPGARYTMPVIGAVGFATCAALVTVIAALVFFPARTAMALRRSDVD